MKIIKPILVIALILITIFNFNVIIDSIKSSFSICINTLLPSLIPFLLLSTIIIKKGLLPNNIHTLNLLCIISGSPSNAKYIKDYIDNGIISEKDSQKLLNYLQFVNPLYILNGIGLITLNNKKLGLIIFISNLVSSFILKRFNNVEFKPYSSNNDTLFNIITDSIKETINTVLYIIGVITTFFIITSYISIIFNIDDKYRFIYGIFEITQGINYLNKSNLSIHLKTIISSFFISFGGLSIHIQIFGILNKKIRYKPYLIYRVIHSLIVIINTDILWCFFIY